MFDDDFGDGVFVTACCFLSAFLFIAILATLATGRF